MPRTLTSVCRIAAALAALAGAAARAQAAPAATCPPVQSGQELKEPTVLRADKSHVLSTTFTVQMKDECVPVAQFNSQGTQTGWKAERQSLRTYVYPDPTTGQPAWGYPGPTLVIRKQVEETVPQNGTHATITPGDRLKVLLVNGLAPDTTEHGKCDSACPANFTCPATLPPLSSCPADSSGTFTTACCCYINQTQKWPDCFHGDNTTNLHFHGTHVSPQPPQDYVLLELRPKLGKGQSAPADPHPAHARGVVAYGQYQYDVDPPPPTQAEGTHWYHPHKHGSVSLQVANGLPGALLIEGPFDDWLRGYYQGHLTEKLLVLQQVQQTTNLYTNPNAPVYTVNGQVSPVVTMQPGEVQRWRFVNATMNVAAQVSLSFPAGVKVRQIAQDGVRFAPENYALQPLFSPRDPSAFLISPGNRADFLIQAPVAPGTYRLTHRLAGAAGENSRARIKRRDRALLALEAASDKTGALAANANAEPALVTLAVAAPKPPDKGGARKVVVATTFPTPAEWPKMPWYLENLSPATDAEQDLTFQMSGGPANPTTQFTINNQQYNDKCVNVTTELETTDKWVVQNSSPLGHPFHIHINPFQLVEQGSVINGQFVPFVKYPTPVWQDTIALPVVNNTWDVKAGPIWNNEDAQKKCPTVCTAAQGTWSSGNWKTTLEGVESVCGCTVSGNGYVLLRHRYREFTGEYVLHCHFLGHEDRGMMFGVQTVCRKDTANFGKSKPYPQPECVPGNLIPSAPVCAATTSGSAAPAGGAGDAGAGSGAGGAGEAPDELE
ncbi:MAG: multicopper oxidase domain-containing protein [Acidobacteriota bacterium]|nr:multicopper oxidase domain-containing protein [Acidobacteriota bacterium]